MSPPLRPAKWNAKAVMRLIAGACARAGVASSPAMMERKILRSVSMMRLPMGFSKRLLDSSAQHSRRQGRFPLAASTCEMGPARLKQVSRNGAKGAPKGHQEGHGVIRLVAAAAL